ncbi:hypothetical protein [Lysobacter gummosus]|uniref:Uncharacterized protein n=1 Tax=Lysobacter gummosus TaxID=262324 RepID=A0ABY3XFY3_9GAMM|nr:hypothetical protein [Lysobacter gummosus]UNP30554.1 hypothetical protein MOV92_04600 [Lysobacter gummosus]
MDREWKFSARRMHATDYAKPIGAACVKRVLVRLVLRKKNAVRQCVRCYFRFATNGDEKVGQTGDRCLIAPLGSAIRRRAHALAIWRLADAVASSRCGIMATVATAPVFSRGCPALDAVSTLSWKSKPASSGKFRRRCAWVPSLCALVRISLHIHLVITETARVGKVCHQVKRITPLSPIWGAGLNRSQAIGEQ